ncbi:cyclophilin-like domain-containing protein [Pelagophyceae sp. CCMP2097]|nr:cyclophilin-like domain-containing protein [Pelagophyceae sp. CCMP2097]
MNFSTSGKRKKAVGSWRDAAQPEKKARDDDAEEGEMARPREEDVAGDFSELKRELADRDRIKALRKKELDREQSVIERTRGGDDDGARTVKETGTLCYMDIEIGKKSRADDTPASGRMIFELFEDVVPRTVKNFVSLITGEKGGGLNFEASTFHRVLPGVSCTGGDIDKGDGSGGKSTYGRDFEDENHTLKHTDAGVLTMFPKRPNANSSQFQILFSEQPELDGRQVVFGRIVDGFAILREIEKLGAPNGTPRELARIKKCGLITFKEESLVKVIEANRAELVLPKKGDDAKTQMKEYRNRSKHYDNSTRSALFSWTTSA